MVLLHLLPFSLESREPGRPSPGHTCARIMGHGQGLDNVLRPWSQEA